MGCIDTPSAECTAESCDVEDDIIVRELSLIQGLFQGALVLRTRCNECESYTERREEFQDISLPVRCLQRSTGMEEDEGVPGTLLNHFKTNFVCFIFHPTTSQLNIPCTIFRRARNKHWTTGQALKFSLEGTQQFYWNLAEGTTGKTRGTTACCGCRWLFLVLTG